MKTKPIENLKLGIFVISGLILLIVALYLLSRNRSFFGDRLELSTQLRDVNGLLEGSNVRFNGINVGNVTGIKILNDTIIEIRMSLQTDMKKYIRKNAIASVGTDGLIGNRLINISPTDQNADFVSGGERLESKELIDTDSMLRTLDRTNRNIVEITEEIKLTLRNIQNSGELNKILNDTTLARNLSASFEHLHETTEKANLFATNAIKTLKTFTEGSGTVSTLLTDTSLSQEIKQVINNLSQMESRADKILKELNQSVGSLSDQINNGKGPVNTLLNDSITARKLRQTIENAERGTALFAEDMKALQSNFLLRPFFKKKLKEEAKNNQKDSIRK